jgi:hypothetical protein
MFDSRSFSSGSFDPRSWFGLSDTPQAPVGGGGVFSRYHPWIHGYEKRRKFLDKHGIPEAVAEAIVEAVATHIPEADGKPDADAIAKAESAAKKAVEASDLVWQSLYSRLILIEYSRLVHEYEDAQIAWLLFEM